MTATILEFKRKKEFKKITNNIFIKVEPHYVPERSHPSENYYFFAYKVIIVNKGDNRVRIMNRDWTIFDGNKKERKVQGEGIVGRRPFLEPGEDFEYTSFCPFETPTGKMHGKLQFKDSNGESFWATVPLFYFKS